MKKKKSAHKSAPSVAPKTVSTQKAPDSPSVVTAAPVPTHVETVQAAPAPPTITLCMIAKNEEQLIAQAINSVRSIVSEVVVVDTGSTDRTVEIVTALGAKVLHMPWDNDFAAPRNLSIQHATGDWILVLDADEAIAETDIDALRSLTRDPRICWEFLQRHYSNDHRLSEFQPVTGEYLKWEKGNAGFFESNLCRLFPNRRGIEYRGRVHELVEHSIREIPDLTVRRTKVRIQHYGHTDEVLARKDKAKLYTPLGEEKLRDDPTHWQSFFEMGVENNRNGRLWESVTAFLQSLNLKPDYIPTWVNMGYVYCELGRYRQAEVSLNGALDLDPKNDEAHCNLGVVYMRANKLPLAERHLRLAIQSNPSYVNAYCNLGKALAMMQRLPEAVAVYRRVLEIMPQCAVALADLGAIYLSSRMFAEAEPLLRGALQLDSTQTRCLFHLGQLYRAVGNSAQAIAALERFVQVEEARAKGTPAPEQARFLAQVRTEVERYKVQAAQAPAR